MTRLPPILVLGWVGVSFLLFLTWLVNWPIYHRAEWATLIAYVALCLLAIAIAAWAGSDDPARVTAPCPPAAALIAGAAAAAALLMLHATLLEPAARHLGNSGATTPAASSISRSDFVVCKLRSGC